MFISQFIFLYAENVPSLCGKFSVHKNINWKINTNIQYILNPANTLVHEKNTSIDLKI